MDASQIIEGGIYNIKCEGDSTILFVVAKVSVEGEKCWGFPGLYMNSKFNYMVNDVECQWADDVISHAGNVGEEVLADIKKIAESQLKEQTKQLLDYAREFRESNKITAES